MCTWHRQPFRSILAPCCSCRSRFEQWCRQCRGSSTPGCFGGSESLSKAIRARVAEFKRDPSLSVRVTISVTRPSWRVHCRSHCWCNGSVRSSFQCIARHVGHYYRNCSTSIVGIFIAAAERGVQATSIHWRYPDAFVPKGDTFITAEVGECDTPRA